MRRLIQKFEDLKNRLEICIKYKGQLFTMDFSFNETQKWFRSIIRMNLWKRHEDRNWNDLFFI